ncbi:NAD-dependent epimerase/dehydratase family protein [Deinococcus psychrotolerans]|uniref:NAD-dependent epimerase/dehydratase family protein n=1 Tax=Deinococcus psychrotolerans TaxID=2489213 RepID=A0A3G8YFR8_9DEIO|nr:NAD(P)H-binding protein [Deinococcus psychrotolerans]AZI43027.1 NAD-dependent epimerase/dehydratase family protein [Deinococcus psychrotolerans]
MIVITGATGQLGHAVTEALLRLLPANQMGVSVRDPAKASAFAERGVRVRRGDFADPASLDDAFEGASQVLIVSSGQSGETAMQQHGAAIDAAKRAGAGRILYTSHMAASPNSAFPPMRTHAATEALLAASGVPYTALRNGFYASSAVIFMGKAPQTGILSAPQDGPVSWTTHADLAEAAALILANEGRFDGPTPPLTASTAFDLAGLGALASDILGKPIERVIISDDQFQATMNAGNVPADRQAISLGFYQASRDGEFGAVDGALAKVLGRSPETMRDFLAGKLSF